MYVAFPRVSLIILGFSLCNICSVPEPGLLLTFSFSHLFFFPTASTNPTVPCTNIWASTRTSPAGTCRYANCMAN